MRMNLFAIIDMIKNEWFPIGKRSPMVQTEQDDFIKEVIRLYVAGREDVVSVMAGERTCENCVYCYIDDPLDSPATLQYVPIKYQCRVESPDKWKMMDVDDWCGRFSKKVDVRE